MPSCATRWSAREGDVDEWVDRALDPVRAFDF
jgi:hypothetical protein